MEDSSLMAAELFKQAAEQWMIQGDARKAADAIDNAAAEVVFSSLLSCLFIFIYIFVIPLK